MYLPYFVYKISHGVRLIHQHHRIFEAPFAITKITPNMELTGKLLEVFEVQQVSGTFRKREFVVEYAENPQYPEFVKFELIQDRTDLVNEFQPGQEVKVAFNLKGRKWTDPKGEVKYFNSLQAWRVDASAQGQPAAAPQGNSAPPPAEEPGWLADSNNNQNQGGGVSIDDDDLPF